jgi:hypothetical protein
MAIPDQANFAQSDVQTELGLGQTSLSACFTAAVDGNFDPVYKGSKDRLSNFRNYNADGLTPYFYSGFPTAVCGTTTTACFHDGLGAHPTVGDTIYQSNGTTPVPGGNQHFRLALLSGTSDYLGEITTLGLLTSRTPCSTSLPQFNHYGLVSLYPLWGNYASDTLYAHFHDGPNTNPIIGDTIYTDITGTTVFNGGSNWWMHIITFQSGTRYQISATGVVLGYEQEV